MNNEQIVDSLKSDGLKVETKTVVNVFSDDDLLVCEINLTDKVIDFNRGFYTNGKSIPTIVKLIADGYDVGKKSVIKIDGKEIGHDINLVKNATSSLRLLTAEQVRNRYEFTDSSGNPIPVSDNRHREMFYEYQQEYIVSHNVDNHLGNVRHCGDISDPSNHPQWFMTQEEWFKIRRLFIE